MRGKLKLLVILIAAAAVIAALALPKTGLIKGVKKNGIPAGVSRDTRIKVKAQTAGASMLGRKISTVGTILPNEEVEIRSEISGKLEAIYFKEGGSVKKGEVLFKINDDELKANFLRARHRQILAEQQEERLRKLFNKNLASQAEYDNVVGNLNVAKAETLLSRAQLDKAEVRAPFSGRIGLRYVSEGGFITPSTPIASLLDTGILKIDFAVSEKYAGQLMPGDKITFTVQGQAQVFSAQIYAVQPNIDASTRTLGMRAIAANPEGLLHPGSLAAINISLKEKETVIIPLFALIPDLKGHKVFIYKDGKAEERRVKIGERTDEIVEVAEGLKAGDMIITSGLLQLRPGMPVEIEKIDNAKSPAAAGPERGL